MSQEMMKQTMIKDSNQERARELRGRLKLPCTQTGDITVRLASSKEELQAALSLLHDAYVHESYMSPTPSGMRFSAFNALPTTATAVAISGGQVIGTITAIQDSILGLPIDKVIDVSHLREQGQRLTEISGLAIHSHYRGSHGDILYRMVKFILNYCEHSHGDDMVVISVNPKHESLYRDVILFDSINEVPVEYGYVKGAPALGQYLRFVDFQEKLLAAYGSDPGPNNLRNYLLAEDKTVLLPRKNTFHSFDTLMTPETLAFFLDLQRLDGTINAHEATMIRAQFNLAGYTDALAKLPADATNTLLGRKHQRFSFRSRAILIDRTDARISPLRIDNIGLNGLGGWTQAKIESSALHARVPISQTQSVSLILEPVYSTARGHIGLRVANAPDSWYRLNDTLAELMTRSSMAEQVILPAMAAG